MVKTKKQKENRKERFYFHLTDTYGGETNYCWIRRYFVDAYSLHGALCVISRELGYNFSLYCEDVYHAKNASIALLLEDYSHMEYLQQHDVASFNQYKNVTGA